METRFRRCFCNLFSEWIWFFTLTSILGGTKAEVRCIPSCQLRLISAFPRELSALDLAHFDEVPDGEFVGLTEESQVAKSTNKGDETHIKAEFTMSEKSSKVQQPFGENNTSCVWKEALNSQKKLSYSKVLSESVAPSSPGAGSLAENSTSNGFYGENELDEDDVADRSRLGRRRGERSAESSGTWSGFRAEGEEGASASHQQEFHLTSWTFALAGDTAHNQAMVHWSGQNSSVSSQRAQFTRGFTLTQRCSVRKCEVMFNKTSELSLVSQAASLSPHTHPTHTTLLFID
ncbi:hypothetical protein LDENG_00212690 [Lucifuga dentata]|nr:hypothetical protein LDENG_00212690 [Lucifuga dentata]